MRRKVEPAQLALAARGQAGGYRHRAGRPRKDEGTHLGHRPRPTQIASSVLHVTLRLRDGGPNLRDRTTFAVLRRCFAAGRDRFGFRLNHFSVQTNHIHLLCEAPAAEALSRGVQGLAIRVARRVNRRVGRSGRLFAARYHLHVLRNPTEVRRTLVYVLRNGAKHGRGAWGAGWTDPCSSAAYFPGWTMTVREPPQLERLPSPPVVEPGTWLLKEGWMRAEPGGRIESDEMPLGAQA